MAVKKRLAKEKTMVLTLRGTGKKATPLVAKLDSNKILMVKTPANGWKRASVLKQYVR